MTSARQRLTEARAEQARADYLWETTLAEGGHTGLADARLDRARAEVAAARSALLAEAAGSTWEPLDAGGWLCARCDRIAEPDALPPPCGCSHG